MLLLLNSSTKNIILAEDHLLYSDKLYGIRLLG